jgi:hypothetical protein
VRTKPRTFLIVLAVTVIALVGLFILGLNCPDEGFALTTKARSQHRLKNRTSPPLPSDFDPNLSLTALLEPGDDTNRWSTQRAGKIDAYVVAVANARPEATNCFMPCRRDIHINVANRPDAPPNEQVVVEVTPPIRSWAATNSWAWREQTLRAQLLGHRCEFEGWLYFDAGHADQSEHTAPGNRSNWRVTAWEIHPITKITVLK